MISTDFARFSDRLQEERSRLGWTQSKAAVMLGVNRNSLAGYETGRAVPDILFLERAHRAGMDAWYLISGMPFSEACIDGIDFEVLAGVERAIRVFEEERGKSIASDKKSVLAKVLYRQIIRRHGVDQDLMNETMELAA